MKDRKKLQKLHNLHRTPNLTVLGWGTIREGGPLPQVLHFVKLPYVDTGVCRAALSPYKVFDEMFCAGDMAEGGIDACQGDSGGPIVYRKVRKENKLGLSCARCLLARICLYDTVVTK